MRKLRLLATALALATMAVSLQAEKRIVQETKSGEPWLRAPADFQGVPFGSAFTEAEAILGRLKCQDSDGSDGVPVHRTCKPAHSAKQVRIAHRVLDAFFIFYEGKLVAIELHEPNARPRTIPESQQTMYRIVAGDFEKQYGTPTIRRTFRNEEARSVAKENPIDTPGQPLNASIAPRLYTSYAVVWENNELYAFVLSGYMERLAGAVIETQTWRKLRGAATPQ